MTIEKIDDHAFCPCGSGKNYYQCCLPQDPKSSTTLSLSEALALALKQYQAGYLQQAESVYRQILQVTPKQPNALHGLGLIALQVGQTQAAIELIERAITIAPSAAMYCNLGNALKTLGRFDAAIEAYHQALALKNDFVEVYNNLAVIRAELGQTDAALADYRRAIELKPDYAEAHNNMAALLQKQGNLDAALAGYYRAIDLKPDFVDAHSNLGVALYSQGKMEAALAAYRKTISLKPDFVEPHVNIGVALQELGQLDEAVESFERALALQPNDVDAHCNLAVTLHAQGKLEAALEHYISTLALAPELADAHNNMAILLLYMGFFEQGWRHYRARSAPGLKKRTVTPPILPFPEWQGETLKGKSILIWPEQGLGDEIQFCRYVSILKQHGASRITLVCKSPLLELFKTLQDVDAVHTQDQPPDAHDYWCLILNLPLYCKTTIDTIPANIPYLHANPLQRDLTAANLKTQPSGFNIGICWKGSAGYKRDADRSIGIAPFKMLFDVPDARFFTLLPGTRDEFISIAGAAGGDLGHEIDEFGLPFEETAALITHLDLVITCDTSIGHLAGALGKQVWIMLPFVADWRWMADREDSPWYPHTRLFRQRRPGDWLEVFERVRIELEAMIANCSPIQKKENRIMPLAFTQKPLTLIQAPVSIGELLDRITILEIKSERIQEPEKLENVVRERRALEAIVSENIQLNREARYLLKELREINRSIWDIKDAIRVHETHQDFGSAFVALIHSVYINNDQRAALKRAINELAVSTLTEEKSYQDGVA